jgi:2-octaprenylphenol hydroxylase
MARRSKPPVIVVAGAGPVGLLFAVLLKRLQPGVALRLIDARPPQAWRAAEIDARVYALSRESQQLLAAEWPVLAARRISPYRRMRVFAGDSPDSAAAVSFDAAEIGEPDLGHIVEDSLLRTVLLEAAAAVGVDTLFGSGVESLEAGTSGVRLRLGDGSDAQADLVVGADGADSLVRAAAGIDTLRKGYAQSAIVTHVETAAAHAATAWQRFLPDGPLALLPLADGRSSVVWTASRSATERRLALPDSEFIAELEAASAGVLGSLGACSRRYAFPLELRHALQYTRAGVVLIGDAAHAVHPLAGQGVNLGLKDAAVLARTLAAALEAGEYPGDEFVLRRYARAQQLHNLAMQFAFDAINEIFGPRLAWLGPLRALGMAAVDRSGEAKRLLMRRALGLDRAGSAAAGHEAA